MAKSEGRKGMKRGLASAPRQPLMGAIRLAGPKPAVNAFRIALETLWTHKLRSFLTVLGIVIGIAAVVLVGAAIGALKDYAIRSTAQTFGSNTFVISQVASVGNLNRKELAEKLRRNPEIYRREAELLARRVLHSTRISPSLQAYADIKARNRTFLAASVTGSTAVLETIRNIRLSGGRFFSREEDRRASSVVVIGADVAEELFPAVDPLGKEIRIQGRPFRVIGIQSREGSSFGASLDRYVWIPLLAFEKIWGSRRTLTIFAQPADGHDFDYSRNETRMALRALRGLKPRESDDFDILLPEAAQSFLLRLAGMVSAAIVPISSVALLVAGIVVMNMMLVSVTERTREIGIRKSLGARRRDILAQVLFESSLLTILGGCAGLLISYLGTFGLSEAFGTEVGLPLPYVLTAAAVSGLVGLAAGLYPAYLASKLPPVEAIRSET